MSCMCDMYELNLIESNKSKSNEDELDTARVVLLLAKRIHEQNKRIKSMQEQIDKLTDVVCYIQKEIHDN